jgi:hypothetical protein
MDSQGAGERERSRIEAFWDNRGEAPARPPPIAELRRSKAALELCALAVRAAWPSFGAVDLDAWLEVERALATDDRAAARCEIGLAWRSLLRGEPQAALEGFTRASTACRELSIVDGYLEAGAGSVLAALEADRIEEGLARARQLARSARSEELAHLEVLAYVALARARRMSGSQELAVHVLRAVAPLAPPAWRRWIAWEQELAGSPSAVPGEIALAASAVDAGSLHALRSLRDVSRSVAPLEADAIDLAHAFDPAQVEASSAMRAFTRGESDHLPRGLHAIGAGAHEDLAYVAASPDGAPRRVLARASSALAIPSLSPDRKPQLRTHSLLARLAWAAPEALDEEALFRELYGFAYERARHKQIFDTLVHRARAKAAPCAVLERGAGRIRLAFQRAALVWDPACRRSVEDRVLAYLAASGSSGARDVASALGLPLRTVQALLHELTTSEGCLAQRDGKNVVYAIEDTCFSELTQRRFLALRTDAPRL